MTRKKPVIGEKGGSPKEGECLGTSSRIVSLVSTGIQAVSELADIYNNVSSSLDSRRTVETDNAIKRDRAETDARKEDNRHTEALAKLELDKHRITDAAADKEARRAILSGLLSGFEEEYKYYLSLSQDAFMDEQTTSRLDRLHDVVSALAMELIRGL